MTSVHTFVTETAVDLENLFKAAHEQFLEVEFRRDAEIKIAVIGIVVGDEGTRRRAAGNGVQHWRFHFQETPGHQPGTHGIHHQDTLAKDIHDLRVGHEVQVTVAVTGFHIRQAVVFFR